MTSDSTASWIARTVGLGPGKPATSPALALAKPQLDAADFGEATGYRAFGHGHPESSMLDVRTRSYQGESARGELLPLHFLLRVSYSCGPLGDHITLAFSDCLITVSGRNLSDLRTALTGGKVGFIEEFDPDRWPRPSTGDAVVEKIDIVAPGRSGGRA